MRITSVVIASLLSSIGLATNESGDQKFATYKASQLSKYSALRLDDAAYGALTAAPRNYSAAVLLTALDPKFGCGACHTFQPEWDLLTKSWIKGDKAGASKVVFGTLDFNDGRGTFHSVSNIGSGYCDRSQLILMKVDATNCSYPVGFSSYTRSIRKNKWTAKKT